MTRIRCDKCDGYYTVSKDTITFESKLIGITMVPHVLRQKCHKCGYTLIPYESAKTISSYMRGKEDEAIKLIPVGEFISSKEAYNILGFTKQAFSKNHRIQRGFIISAIIGGRRLYNKKSVELFRDTNDGRFLVKRPNSEIQWVRMDWPEMVFNYTENWIQQSRSPKVALSSYVPAADNYDQQKREPIYG